MLYIYEFVISPMRATSPSNLILLHLIVAIMPDEEKL
jgi:hypothetical protein